MSVTPQDLWKHSQQLFSDAKEEAHFRSSIGRAYYAVYHACLLFHAALPSPGCNPPAKVGVHSELVHRLTNPTFAKSHEKYSLSRQLGLKLTGFHALRVMADYALTDHVVRPHAANALIKASAIFKLLDA
jgi:uncharacterized protein (UPF0332 family)